MTDISINKKQKVKFSKIPVNIRQTSKHIHNCHLQFGEYETVTSHIWVISSLANTKRLLLASWNLCSMFLGAQQGTRISGNATDAPCCRSQTEGVSASSSPSVDWRFSTANWRQESLFAPLGLSASGGHRAFQSPSRKCTTQQLQTILRKSRLITSCHTNII